MVQIEGLFFEYRYFEKTGECFALSKQSRIAHTDIDGYACRHLEKTLAACEDGTPMQISLFLDIPEEKKKYDPVKSAWDDSVTPKVINESFDFSKPCYLVNESTREYIDLLRLEEINRGTWGGSIHPLPLLTAVGNGRGGGDYHGSRAINQRMVGAWAGDLLTIEESVPTSEDGFLEYIDITDDAHFSED